MMASKDSVINGDNLPYMSISTPLSQAEALENMCENDFQDHLLQGVSRTFALTIPQLPKGLSSAVSNAYLLCRIVDTIEDEVDLDSKQKRTFCTQFASVVRGKDSAESLKAGLAPLLSSKTLPAEHELIDVLPRVVRITHNFDPDQREALATCVEIMAKGMIEFQDRDLSGGLKTMAEMDHYCYYVAGVVGEMLTKLFCHYSPEIAAHREQMMKLAVSFGQGLQMTNILKDLWDDQSRQVCWLPQEVFDRNGKFKLSELKPGQHNESFRSGFLELVGIAHWHLKNALEYTLLLPKHEAGIREFCLWALGMAILTLRKIAKNPDFDTSSQVKITRRAVKTTIFTCRLLRSSNVGLKAVFNLAGAGVPLAQPDELPTSH
jgi:farnesyl-diphosphate farnesyltransferase